MWHRLRAQIGESGLSAVQRLPFPIRIDTSLRLPRSTESPQFTPSYNTSTKFEELFPSGALAKIPVVFTRAENRTPVRSSRVPREVVGDWGHEFAHVPVRI